MMPILVIAVLWLLWQSRDKLPKVLDVILHQRVSPIKPGSDGAEYLPDRYVYVVRYADGTVQYVWTETPLETWDALRPVEEWPNVHTDFAPLKALGWDSI
jgi:hypothetical protein